MKRGATKAYKEFLNQRYPQAKDECGKGPKGNLKPSSRAYGDYLYSQDRGMFMANLMDSSLDPDFDREPWL